MNGNARQPDVPPLKTRPLGRTGLAVSPLGYGAFKIGRNEKTKYAQAYDLPDDAAVARLLEGILELGVTHFDTAPAYGLSEERLGRHLAGRLARERDRLVLSTKVGEIFEHGESRYAFDAAAVRASVEQSRRRLGVDVLDVVLIHAPADDVRVLTETPVVETLLALKSAGRIRAIGLSGKTPAAATLALEWADVLMVEYHLEDRSHAEVIAQAAARGVGVLVKKGLASGRLPAETAIPFVLDTPGVCGLVVGGLSLEHLAANVRVAREEDRRAT